MTKTHERVLKKNRRLIKMYPELTQVSRGPPAKPKQPPPAPLPAPYFVQMGDGSLREFSRLQINFYGIKQARTRHETRRNCQLNSLKLLIDHSEVHICI